MTLQVKRVYDPPDRNDGTRVLVDRIWPRGLSKETAALDEWLRECAPSDDLRKWFGHDKAKWAQFKRKYFAELKDKGDMLEPLRKRAKTRRVTLLFGAADTERNNAVALMEFLTRTKPDAPRAKNERRASQAKTP